MLTLSCFSNSREGLSSVITLCFEALSKPVDPNGIASPTPNTKAADTSTFKMFQQVNITAKRVEIISHEVQR